MASLFSFVSMLLVIGVIIFLSVRGFSMPTQPSDEKEVASPQRTENIFSAIDSAKEAKQLIESRGGVEEKVETVDMSGQGLTEVPKYVFEQTNTVVLNLSNNVLTGALQAEVRQLTQLKTLNLSHNQFTGVPAEVGQLQSLEVLDLSNNKLTGLPYELGNLSKLRLLDLRGNDYSEADLEIIKKTLPKTVLIKTN